MNTTLGVCPVCGHEDLGYGQMHIEADWLWYDVICPNCHSTFEETYELDFIGYENIEEGNNEE